jgi:putative DNA primase/helicase
MSDDHGDDGSGEERRAGINHAQPRLAAEQERQGQGPSIVVVRASEIEPERVGWIWPGIIARGKVTGLVGHPGLGKSQVATDAAATVSTGRPWPGDVTNDAAGDVIILSAEDDPADTGVPRLIAARADRTRIHFLKAVKENRQHGALRPILAM